MAAHPGGHRWRALDGLVQPDEVVMREMQRNRRAMVLNLLGERIGQPREPADAHAHRQVLPLDQAGRDMLGIGCATRCPA
jgi:hypothetical protein